MKSRLARWLSRLGNGDRHRGDHQDGNSASAKTTFSEPLWLEDVTRPLSPQTVSTMDILQIMQDVHPFTMTGPERTYDLCRAVDYIVTHDIPGDMVECGVWKGGSMLAVALMLRRLGVNDRRLHLFDTFDGMTPPGDRDIDFRGSSAKEQLADTDKWTDLIWAASSLEEVRATMATSQYNADNIRYVQGSVEETLPSEALESISLLRLDTDWYASTRAELVHLYPRLVPGGVLIIDDYGHWKGAQEAVDEYFRLHEIQMRLHPIDYSARIGIKPQQAAPVAL